MGEKDEQPLNLLQRVTSVQIEYASHHRVAYAQDTLKAIAFLANSLPYVRGDAYDTALDLLDETGAFVRGRNLVADDNITIVGLTELAEIVARKTGHSLDEFINESP